MVHIDVAGITLPDVLRTDCRGRGLKQGILYGCCGNGQDKR